RHSGAERPVAVELLRGPMRFTIGFKIFSIALGLLVLMGAAALLSLRMTQTIDAQLVVVDQNYFPGFTTLATANVSSLTQGMLARRLVLNLTDGEASNPEKQKRLREQIAAAGTVTDA